MAARGAVMARSRGLRGAVASRDLGRFQDSPGTLTPVIEHDGALAPKLLIVEDDRALTELLRELFGAEGYVVTVAQDAQQGLHRALTQDFDAAIIDRGLPGRDGAELVAVLRADGIATPVMLLTAKGTLADLVEGLDAGAQDYVVKPFEVPELLARVRALLRRPDGGAVVRAGGLCLDRVSNTVAVIGSDPATVTLTKREAALLAVFMTAPHRVFTRRQLLGAAFDGVETPGTVDTYVHYLRRKLGQQVIRTLHGAGYRFGGR